MEYLLGQQVELETKEKTSWELLGNVEKTKRRVEGGVMFRMAYFTGFSYKTIKEL